MSKPSVAVRSALFAAPLFALIAALPSSAGSSLPLLSGTYLITINTTCQPTLTVDVEKKTVAQVALGPGSNALLAGTITFTQGGTPGTGTAVTNLTVDSGSPFLQAGNESGVDDAPLHQSTGVEDFTFTQTATTLSLVTSGAYINYNVSYGPTSRTGIASSAVFAGMDSQGCANNGMAMIN
jgi:hypothetical protein